MTYTYYELQQQVLTKLDEVGASTTTANVKIALNNANQRRSNQHPWSWMVTPPTVVTSTPGQRILALDHDLQHLMTIRNTTAGIDLKEIDQRHFAQLQPTTATLTGSARRYTRWGSGPVRKQPTVPTTLRIVSDDPLDTGSTYRVVIKYKDENGNERAEAIVPNGTTPVDGGRTVVSIIGYAKTGDWNGNLTISNTADTEVYVVLLPWEMGKQYQQLYLYEEPTVAESFTYTGRRQPLGLVNDYDQPHIPGGDSAILVYDALIELSPYIKDISPQDIAVWGQLAKAHENNLYLRELGEGFNTEGQTIHLPDDGWDDTY
jgi:hypothetical protein